MAQGGLPSSAPLTATWTSSATAVWSRCILPGHTPDHFALLVKLKSGPVLLSGDVVSFAREPARSAESRRSTPIASRPLASMDQFEKIAKETGAKVVIQHEPRDIAILPAFPQAAE